MTAVRRSSRILPTLRRSPSQKGRTSSPRRARSASVSGFFFVFSLLSARSRASISDSPSRIFSISIASLRLFCHLLKNRLASASGFSVRTSSLSISQSPRTRLFSFDDGWRESRNAARSLSENSHSRCAIRGANEPPIRSSSDTVCSLGRGKLGNRICQTPHSRALASTRAQVGLERSFLSSAKTLSRATVSRSCTHSAAPRSVSSSISKSSCAANRNARSIRNASSENLFFGSPTVRTSRLSISATPPKGSTSPRRSLYAIALTVRSLRERSSAISSAKVTPTGCLKSLYSPSILYVVISTGTALFCVGMSTVSVPCLIPVGTVRRSRKTSIICSGVALVATSQSDGSRPIIESRTAPPTA